MKIRLFKKKKHIVGDPNALLDADSNTWRAIIGKIQEEKQRLMERLSMVNVSERQADVIRGQIKMCDYVLDMPNDDEDLTLLGEL